MTTPFDPKTYVPTSAAGALAGFSSAHDVPLRRFEDLSSDAELKEIDTALRESADPQARDWRHWLVFDACVARFGGMGGVVEALGDITPWGQ